MDATIRTGQTITTGNVKNPCTLPETAKEPPGAPDLFSSGAKEGEPLSLIPKPEARVEEKPFVPPERTNIHMGIASNWLRKSMVGLFVGLTLFAQLGCNPHTVSSPPPQQTEQVQVINEQPSVIKDFASREEFKTAGTEVLTQVAATVHRFGGDLYGKTAEGKAGTPITAQQAYDAILKGESFYVKGSPNADAVEITSIRDVSAVSQEIMKEAARTQVEATVSQVAGALQQSEYGQKVLTHLGGIAKTHGGDLYGREGDGMGKTPLSPVDAYQALASGKSIYFQGSATSAPMEVKSFEQLGTVYTQVAKDASVQVITAEGIQMAKDQIKNSEQAQKVVSRISEIVGSLGGSIRSGGEENKEAKDLEIPQVYPRLARGESVFVKITKDSKAVEIKNLDELASVYKAVLKDAASQGIKDGAGWLQSVIEKQLGEKLPGSQK
jgi:hypothetical protein